MKPRFIKGNDLDHKSCPGSGDWCVCMIQHNRVYGQTPNTSLSTATWTQYPSGVESPHFTFPGQPSWKLCHIYQVVTENPLFLCRTLKMWARSSSMMLYKYAPILMWKDSLQDEELVLWNIKSLAFLQKQPRPIWYQLFASRDTCPLPENPFSHWQPHESKLASGDWSLSTAPVLPPLLPQFSAFF